MKTDTVPGTPAASATATGRVTAVCYSAELIDGVGKEPHTEGQITRWGIPGDHHYGETRIKQRPTPHAVPNNRPITVVGAEDAREVCERLGIAEIPPGGLGENILVDGLGGLSHLTPGDRIRLHGKHNAPPVELIVRKQNEPCSNLSIYHRLMPKELFGKRGVICEVLSEGPVRVGDSVEIVRGKEESGDDGAYD